MLGLVPQSAPVNLGRVFTANEKLAYAVRSHLSAERRGRGLQTWLPEDLDLNYDFTTHVQALKADGIAVMRYKRPQMEEIEGETFDSGPKTKIDKVNFDYQLTVSPYNEILEEKDLKPKKTDPKKKTKGVVFRPVFGQPQVDLGSFVGQFVSELYRLSLFAGAMDSALDFAPKTPFDAVKVGDTWKRTVGYQPQKLKGKGGKQAVQRLDYTYTFKGVADGDSGKVLRVEAKLNFTTDLAEFISQLTDSTPEQTGLKKFPLTMDATILFDLDPKTKHTLKAVATSQAGFQMFANDDPDTAAFEERMKGKTTMRLVGRSIVPVGK